MAEDYILELKGITKIFPGVKALNNVQFQLKRGEVHALMGENGAGKSTFIKVITGVHAPEEGEMCSGSRNRCGLPAPDILSGTVGDREYFYGT